MKSQEVKTSLMFVKHSVHELHKEISDKLSAQSNLIANQQTFMQHSVDRLSEVLEETKADIRNNSSTRNPSSRGPISSVPPTPKAPKCLDFDKHVEVDLEFGVDGASDAPPLQPTKSLASDGSPNDGRH